MAKYAFPKHHSRDKKTSQEWPKRPRRHGGDHGHLAGHGWPGPLWPTTVFNGRPWLHFFVLGDSKRWPTLACRGQVWSAHPRYFTTDRFITPDTRFTPNTFIPPTHAVAGHSSLPILNRCGWPVKAGCKPMWLAQRTDLAQVESVGSLV